MWGVDFGLSTVTLFCDLCVEQPGQLWSRKSMKPNRDHHLLAMNNAQVDLGLTWTSDPCALAPKPDWNERERVVLLEKEAGSELSRWGGSEGSEGRPSAELVFASAVLKYVQQHHSERGCNRICLYKHVTHHFSDTVWRQDLVSIRVARRPVYWKQVFVHDY